MVFLCVYILYSKQTFNTDNNDDDDDVNSKVERKVFLFLLLFIYFLFDQIISKQINQWSKYLNGHQAKWQSGTWFGYFLFKNKIPFRRNIKKKESSTEFI